jgi:hypothetical protein
MRDNVLVKAVCYIIYIYIYICMYVCMYVCITFKRMSHHDAAIVDLNDHKNPVETVHTWS